MSRRRLAADPPAHPAADLFPEIDAAALRLLADDIAEHGLQEPIVLLGGPERRRP